MNPVRSILKNASAYTFSQIITTFSRAALVFFISRWLAVEGLGVYSIAMSVFQVTLVIAVTGLSNYLPREISKDPTQTNRYFMHASLLTICAALLGMVGLSLLPGLFEYSPQSSQAIYLISLALVPGTIAVVLQAVFLAHERMEVIAFVSLADAVSYVGVSVLLLWAGYGVNSVLVCFVVFRYLVMFTLLYLMGHLISGLRWEFDFSFLKQVITDIRAFVVISLQGAVFARSETLILSFSTGEREVGLFSAAIWLVSLWDLMPRSYASVVFPMLTRAYHDNSQRRTKLLQEKSIKYLLALGWPIAVGLALVADKIIPVVFGPEFEAAVWPLQIMCLTVLLNSFNPMLWKILFARDEQHLALRAQRITVIITLMADVILIYWLGYLGAAIASVIGYVTLTVTHLHYISQDDTNLRIWPQTWRFALASVGMGLFIITLGQPFNLFVLIPTSAMVYGVLVWLLRGFSADDKLLLNQVWRPRQSANIKPL